MLPLGHRSDLDQNAIDILLLTQEQDLSNLTIRFKKCAKKVCALGY